MIDRKIALLAVGGALLGGCSMVEEGPATDAAMGNGSQASTAIPARDLTPDQIAALTYREFPGINKCFGDWAQNDWPRDMNQVWVDGVQTNPNYGKSLAFVQGTRVDGSPVLPERSDPSHAAGGPNGSPTGGFTSLGIGGTYIARMPLLVRDQLGDDILLHEVTGGSYTCANYPEVARVEVSYDGVVWAELAGTACGNGAHGFDLATLGDDAPWQLKHFGARFVKVIDISDAANLPNDADGFDLDSIEAVHCGGNERTIDLCSEGFYAWYEQSQGVDSNGNPIPAARSNPDNGLGLPEDVDDAADEPAGRLSFYTLGRNGGSIVYVFDGWVETTEVLRFVETSYGRNGQGCNTYREQALIEVSDGSTDANGDTIWVELGTVCRDGEIGLDGAALAGLDRIAAVRLTDLTDQNGSDGYDFDGVTCGQPLQ